MSCRLLFLVGQLGPGGLERQLFYLLQAMDRERYKPTVAVWNSAGNEVYGAQIRALGVPLYALSSAVSGAGKLVEFRRWVRELKPEVVHSYSFYTNFAATWATFGSKAIPIGSIRSNFIIERRRAGRFLGKLSSRWPRAQICNSRGAQKAVLNCARSFKPELLHVVQNGVDIDQFKVNPTLPSDPSLLAVGRLHPIKRWDRLLKVIASVAARGLRFFVRHAGDGPLSGELQAQAKHLGVDRLIEFLGPRRDIAALLADSTLLIHTADNEGCPNVVMEAMACGRAVVSTDAGDVPYLVEDGKTGFVVRRGDDATLADRTATLITDRALCRSMGKAGRTRAEQEFGLNRLVSETLGAYKEAGWRDS